MLDVRLTGLLSVTVLLMLLGPLLTSVAIRPKPVAAQDGGSSESIYDSSLGPVFTLPQWNDGSGWNNAGYYTTIQLGDINGDGADEMLARGAGGMIVESWDTKLGLWKTIGTEGPFSDTAGWNHPQYYETIQTGDIDGDGAAELLGRSSGGMDTYKWIWDETNQTGTWSLLQANVPAFSNEESWDDARFYSTIQTADIDGDGADELLARSAGGMNTYKWTRDETNQSGTWTLLLANVPAFSDKEGWGDPRFYSTIQTADINGDGADELLARSASGMLTYKWENSTWRLLKASGIFTDKAGWNEEQYYATIQTGDIDGDGAADLLSRSYHGMIGYSWTGGGWRYLGQTLSAWSTPGGWNYADHYRTIQTGDIDGDGADEILGRSAFGMDSYKWDGSNWQLLISSNPQLTNDHWGGAESYLTIQTGDIDGDKAADLVARGFYGIRTWSYNKVSPNAWDNPTAYGFPAFTGVEAYAFDFIDDYLMIESGQTIRDQYTTDANTLTTYQNCLLSSSSDNQWEDWSALPTDSCIRLGPSNPIRPPSELTLAAWNNIAEQIFNELGSAQSVSDYYSGLLTLYKGIFANEQSILTSVAETLYGEDMSEQSANAVFTNLFLAPFALSSLGGDVAAAVGGTLSALIGAGVESASGNSYQGKWSEAQTRYTEISEQIEDTITNGSAFVAGDASYLIYVGEQKDSGRWDPSDDWVVRSITSEGRKQFTLWISQTLSPVIWQFQIWYYAQDDQCNSSGFDFIQYYFTNDNANHDCIREVVTNDFDREIAPAAPLHTILDPTSSSCVPTQGNSAWWEYGSCSLGVPKTDFFFNRDGWQFKSFHLCESVQGCDTSSTAVAAEVAPGDPDNTIHLHHSGSVDVVIYGSADFDASSTIHSSLEFAGASPVGWWVDQDDWHPTRLRDVNNDGYIDAVASFAISDLQLIGGETTALLTGYAKTTRFKLFLPVTVPPPPIVF